MSRRVSEAKLSLRDKESFNNNTNGGFMDSLVYELHISEVSS